MHQISCEFLFCYAHRLKDHPGKCRHLHGHNGRVLVTLEARTLDEQAMVMDFARVKATVGVFVSKFLDHATILQEDDPLAGILTAAGQMVFETTAPPTAEVLAQLIFEWAQHEHLPVVQVTFWETDSCSATYFVEE